jgi:Peptidase M15
LKMACNHQKIMSRGLWRAVRTATLLAGAGFSSVLMVNLPTASAAFVPASDKWITQGTGATPERAPLPASAIEQLETGQPTPDRKPRGVQLASLGRDVPRQESTGRSLSGGPVRWSASSNCLNATLRRVIAEVSSNFGPLAVNSTCRSRHRNAGVGGAPRSRHLTGDAVDFSVGGNVRAVLAFLGGHRAVGGLKHYSDGHFHIDTGPRRTW